MKANWVIIYRSFMALCMGVIGTWIIGWGINIASTASQRMFTTPEIRMTVEKNHQLYPTSAQLKQIQDILNSPQIKNLNDTTYVTRAEFDQFMKEMNENYFYIRRDISTNSNTNLQNQNMLRNIIQLLEPKGKK